MKNVFSYTSYLICHFVRMKFSRSGRRSLLYVFPSTISGGLMDVDRQATSYSHSVCTLPKTIFYSSRNEVRKNDTRTIFGRRTSLGKERDDEWDSRLSPLPQRDQQTIFSKAQILCCYNRIRINH